MQILEPSDAIQKLKAAIEADTRVAELRYSVANEIDLTAIDKIVAMKRELDQLYIRWVEELGLAKGLV